MNTDDIVSLVYFGVSFIMSMWFVVPRIIDLFDPDEDEVVAFRIGAIIAGTLLSPLLGGVAIIVAPMYYLVPKSKTEKKLDFDRREKELRVRQREIERMERELGVGR